MAAVVGFILLFALALTYYANVARDDVPEWGAQSERAWDAEVGGALARIGRAATSGIGTDATVGGALPSTPPARALDVPFVRPAEPIPATGTLSFAPACGGFTAAHTLAGATVIDLAPPTTGCLIFVATTPYGQGFGYDIEHGGLLRVQGDRAVVLAGPGLELRDLGTHHKASLTLMRLTGSPASGVAGPSPLPLDLIPGPSTLDVTTDPNGSNATWTLKSRHPQAWADWFEGQIRAAGFSSSSFACTFDASRPACAGLGANDARVVLEGPMAGSTLDLAVSISYAEYGVRIG